MSKQMAVALALLLAVGALSLGGCAPPLPPLKAYQGPDQSDAQLAIVSQNYPNCLISIAKDNRPYYDNARDDNGNASFSVTLPVNVPGGQWVTATTTDPAGNTSEFSADIAVSALPVASIISRPAPQA